MKEYNFEDLLKSGELKDKKAIITIGVFDGFHLGHQSLVKGMLKEKEKYPEASLVLITFNHNPKTDKPKNVDTLRLRKEMAEKNGINSFVVIDFSTNFSRISGCGFIELLLRSFDPIALVVGEDFRFGHPSSAQGAKDLASLFLQHGKRVEVVIKKSILTEGGEKISSTLVRRVIEKGEVECISSLIGRDYRVDIMDKPFELNSVGLVMLKSSIQQLLPPPGVYGAKLAFKECSLIVVDCIIDDSKVVIDKKELMEKVDDAGKLKQLDSIYFLEKKNGIK